MNLVYYLRVSTNAQLEEYISMVCTAIAMAKSDHQLCPFIDNGLVQALQHAWSATSYLESKQLILLAMDSMLKQLEVTLFWLPCYP